MLHTYFYDCELHSITVADNTLKGNLYNLLVLICVLAFGSEAWAQGPTSWWFFGDKAGIRFVDFNASAHSDNLLWMGEGCGAISSEKGELLYYAAPDSCHNSMNLSVFGSSNLEGDVHPTQGALLVPNPVDKSITYLFTISTINTRRLSLHVIRKSLIHPNGSMSVSEKNIVLNTRTSERLTAVHHANGKDIWVINVFDESDTIAAYLVTEAGVDPNPVYSMVHPYSWPPTGQIKASPDGRYLAECLTSYDFDLFLYKFNDETGEITNPIMIPNPELWSYGAEFTADSRYLYASDHQGPEFQLFRYTMDPFDSTAIQLSCDTIPALIIGALQIGIDRNIYGTVLNKQNLLRIEQASAAPGNVIVDSNAIFLLGDSADFGLPDFITSFFRPAYFDYTGACVGDTVEFMMRYPDPDSLRWDFGDPGSGPSNFSTSPEPRHYFSDSGTFTVTLILWADSTIDTFSREISLVPPPLSFDLGDTLYACLGDTVELNMAQNVPFAKYMWHDSTASETYTAIQSERVWGVVYNHCDTLSDTVEIRFVAPLIPEIGPDTAICEDTTRLLDPSLPPGSALLWSTGSTEPSITVGPWLSQELSPVLIWLEATNACGSFNDTMLLNFIPIPKASLPADSTHCYDHPVYIRRASQANVQYVWSDGSTAEVFRIDSSSTVWLEAANECGIYRDSFSIGFYPEIRVELGEDTFICPGDSVVLNAAWPGSHYDWQGVSSGLLGHDSVLVAGIADLYVVSISNGPCTAVESRRLMDVPEACASTDCKFAMPNVFTPNGDGINDVLHISNTCDKMEYEVFIYNRWGQLVFFDRMNANGGKAYLGWDGHINGQTANDGTYYMVIEDKEGRIQKGSFSLKR